MRNTIVSLKHAGKRVCGKCDRKSHCVGRKLPAEDSHSVDSLQARAMLVQRGETLFGAGEHFSNLYVVRSGCIKAAVYSSSGEEHITGFYLPGDVIGFDGLAGGLHRAHAVAVATSSVCVITYASVMERCRTEPQLQAQVMRWCAADISRGQELVKDLTCRSAPARFARFLLTMADEHAERGYSGREFTLPMMRSDIAHHLGMAPETISRAIKRLQQSGAVRINRHDVTVLNLETLERLAENAECSTLRKAG